jgi:hypothetical protein
MSSFTSNEAYDRLINLRDKLTRLNGVITPEAADKLEDELGRIFTVAKTVVSLLDMYRTKVLMYRTMVLMARLTKVRC